MKITDEAVEAFTQYRRSQVAEMRPWQSGDDMSGVSVSAEDAKAGSPKSGDMIARNPKNHADQWLVAAAYFAENFEPIDALSPDPVGVTDEMVLKFITTSRDEDAGYQNWTEAVTAGLNATLASHEPAPTEANDELERLDADANAMAWGVELKSAKARNLELEADLEVANDKVERLRKEIEAAKNDLRGFLTTFVHEHFPENKIWEPFPDLLGMLSQMDNASTIARDYVARIAELVKALEPFVRHLNEMKFDLDYEGNELPGDQTCGWVYLTLADFRRARATLGGQSNEA